MKNLLKILLTVSTAMSFAFSAQAKSISELKAELKEQKATLEEISSQLSRAKLERRTEIYLGIPVTVATLLFGGFVTATNKAAVAAGEEYGAGTMALGPAIAGAGAIAVAANGIRIHVVGKQIDQLTRSVEQAQAQVEATEAALDAAQE